VRWAVEVPESLAYLGQRGDLAEILGNLMENASKWAAGSARVRAGLSDGAFTITVEDDGPGFGDQAQALLERGARGDTVRAGHGIGLAVVRDIVADLGGRLELGASELGGACVEVMLPADRGRQANAVF
jgi:signal transduction histidine kinase